MGGVLSRSQKMFSLLLLPSAALAWAPAPGIPLERQIPVNRQTTGAGSGSGSGCDFEPWTQECNATQIWCDSGYYNDYTCWYGNYCLDQVSSWDGCPGVCHMPCNWDTEEYSEHNTGDRQWDEKNKERSGAKNKKLKIREFEKSRRKTFCQKRNINHQSMISVLILRWHNFLQIIDFLVP